MSKYVLSIDQGTTSNRAILFDKDMKACFSAQKEFTQFFPNNGWVEHDAEEIISSTLDVCKDVLKKANVSAKDIVSIGITNQRETTILWDRKTGKPIYRAIVWQDRRTSDYCKQLKSRLGLEERIQNKTGLLLDPYFSATKIKWILDNVEGARAKADKGELAFGTVECFTLWHLTKGQSHFSDMTNASRTLLFNIQTKKWDDELCDLFDIPKSILPVVKPNIAEFGHTSSEHFGEEIPVHGMAGDQQAAAFGQACFTKGMVKSTYGTGCFALKNIGTEFKKSNNRLLTTIAYDLGNGQSAYAIEGSIFVAGSAIQFLRDGLGIIERASDTESLAQSIPDNDGVYFVPALTGLGAPYWDAEARGVISGLTRGTTRAHFARAALEAQAYQTMDLFKAMEKDSGLEIKQIRVDGGLVANNWMCQFLANMTNALVDRPVITETTALGAALLAGLQSGFYNDLEQITNIWKLERQFKPEFDTMKRNTLYDGWQRAIQKAKP